MYEIGDKVQYVPAENQKFQKDSSGGYMFRFGLKKPGKSGTVEELSNSRLDNLLNSARSHRSLMQDLEANLVLLGPKKTFEATITEVHDDLTCDLEVPVGNGVTLSLTKVCYNPSKPFNTFHV